MSSFNIPWKCLDLESEPKNKIISQPETTPNPPKTFAQALTNLCDIPLSQLPHPVVKGDRLAIEIPETLYQVGLEACKHNLHGRILWPKGSTPLSVVALKAKVRSIPSWNLNPGLLKLFAWSKDFNPRLQHNTSAQVWVRFYGLSQEYWHKNILFTIASSLGTPICTDSVTSRPMHERTFGQFSRVLIDMDLSQPLRYNVLVERKDYAFFIDIEYENVPEFCSECQIIGHHVDNCKRWNKEEGVKVSKDVRKNPLVEIKKTYVQVKETRPQQGNENGIVNVEKETIIVDVESESPSKQVEYVTNVLPIQNPTPSQQTSPVYKETTVLTPVLSPAEQFKVQDHQLERELNANVEVVDGVMQSDSDDSIVNTTQFQVENAKPSSANADLRQTPDRILKDMEFLKASWAAMAEEEEEGSQNLEVAENDMQNQEDADNDMQQHNDGFQVSLSRVNSKPFK
ncbi:hypothetical protein P8452_52077 [Trifolium repens]|nr:hypothetical protein P8452_52077 [Trifolium repens]